MWADDPICPVDSETKAATAAVVASLRSVGATVSEVARPAFDAAEMFRIYLTLLGATMCWNAEGETRAMHESVAKGFGPAPPAEGCGNNVSQPCLCYKPKILPRQARDNHKKC